MKDKWEKKVELENAQKAARAIEITIDGIDYINIFRMEELCLSLFAEIPFTPARQHMQEYGILDRGYRFDERNVRENISNGRYLFDYPNSYESFHYKFLLVEIANKVMFEDFSFAVDKGTPQRRPWRESMFILLVA